MAQKFIQLKNNRFKISEISHYSCHKSSVYTSHPPLIKIFKKRFKEGYEIIYWSQDGNRKPDIEGYNTDKNILDELLLGKTEEESKILP